MIGDRLDADFVEHRLPSQIFGELFGASARENLR
jgi:hypothetical protein